MQGEEGAKPRAGWRWESWSRSAQELNLQASPTWNHALDPPLLTFLQILEKVFARPLISRYRLVALN